MKDKEKLIIIFYIDVSKFTRSHAHEYLYTASESLRNYFDDTVKTVFMPSDENRVDCINPVLMDEEQYKKVTDKVNDFDVKFKEWIKEHGISEE